MAEIKLSDIMDIGDPARYKLHLGCRNPDGDHPLLEIYGMHSADDFILLRENYWKEKLGTREHGYNSN